MSKWIRLLSLAVLALACVSVIPGSGVSRHGPIKQEASANPPLQWDKANLSTAFDAETNPRCCGV
jgi:hypothetical protein